MQKQKKIEAKYYTILQSMRLFSEPIKSSSYVAPCEQAFRRKNHQTMRNQNDAAGGSPLPFCYPAWQMALR